MLYHEIEPNIKLKLLEPHHTAALFAAVDANRDHLRPWFPWVDGTESADDTRSFITNKLHAFANGDEIHLGIWEEDEVIGVIGFNHIHQHHRACEIGYWLIEAAQGRGIVTKACRALIAYAFQERAMNRIVIRAEPANVSSCAVAKRLGFSHEGTQRQIHKKGDHFIDLELYSLLANEYTGS